MTQVTSRYPPDLGGMERAVKELSEALAVEIGGPVEVITGFHGPSSTDQEGGVSVHRLRSFDVGVTPVVPRLPWVLVRRPRPDIFHVHVAHAGTVEAVALAARLEEDAVHRPRPHRFRAHHLDGLPPRWLPAGATGTGADPRRLYPGTHGQLPAHARREVPPRSEPGPGPAVRHSHGDTSASASPGAVRRVHRCGW